MCSMTDVQWSHFPLVAAHEHAHRWLQFIAHLGRARNTVEAYGRALDDHLRFCGSVGADPLKLRADVIAAWIGDLHERTNPLAANVLHLRFAGRFVQRRDSAADYRSAVVLRVPRRRKSTRTQSGSPGRVGPARQAAKEGPCASHPTRSLDSQRVGLGQHPRHQQARVAAEPTHGGHGL